MFEEFLLPANPEVTYGGLYSSHELGSCVEFSTDPLQMQIALIGVKEERGSVHNVGCNEAPDEIRKHLYHLAKPNGEIRFVDLGNIEEGATVKDTLVAISKIVNELIRMKIIPIIIGGSHDLTYGQFGAYYDLKRNINISIVDNRIDLKEEQENLDDENFLLNILMYEPSFIFNLNMIGYQTQLASTYAMELMEKLNFDIHRLGKIQTDINEMEPVLRATNLLSFDMAAVRFSDSQGSGHATPNGLYAEQACQLARYAGQSEQLDSFGIYGCNPLLDMREQSSRLAAEMIWYFMDGFYNRKNDFPDERDNDYLKYTIHFKENKYEMNFWKSRKSDRWWMEVPTGGKPRNKKKFHLIPCSYNDYQVACREEVPERWMKAYQKLS